MTATLISRPASFATCLARMAAPRPAGPAPAGPRSLEPRSPTWSLKFGRRCRSATVKDVAAEMDLHWTTVKDIDKARMYPNACKDELGRLLALMHEIDHNGLRPLLGPLIERGPTRPPP